MRWLEVRVAADTEAVEAVSEPFARYGYQGGVAIEEQYAQDNDGDNLRVDPSQPVIVTTYLAETPGVQETVAKLEQALWHLSQMRYVGSLTVNPREEEDWANA